MKLECERNEAVLAPENAVEAAYLEETLGMRPSYPGRYIVASVRCRGRKVDPEVEGKPTQGLSELDRTSFCEKRAGHGGRCGYRNLFRRAMVEFDPDPGTRDQLAVPPEGTVTLGLLGVNISCSKHGSRAQAVALKRGYVCFECASEAYEAARAAG